MFDTAWTTEAYQQVCQDRVSVFSAESRTVIVVADGAGGTGSGGQAAAAVVDEVRRAIGKTQWSDGWCDVLHRADGQIGPGESTVVVVDVRADSICGASVGDSQAWIVNGADIANHRPGSTASPCSAPAKQSPSVFGTARSMGYSSWQPTGSATT